jgi:parvulin-like peptidyl-prolyl isomerase
MSQTPKFTLPPREEWAPSRSAGGGRGLLAVIAVLLLAVLSLEVYLALRPAAQEPAGGGTRPHSILPPKELREVAVRLQRANLHAAAASAYEEYVASADLSSEERGNLLLEAGNLLARAGRYEDALGLYFRADGLVSEANRGPLNRKVQECLQRLGKHAEQSYELSDSLSPQRPAGGQRPGDKEASQPVAWIGPEKITASDLDGFIAREVDERAASMPGLPPERLAELKAEAQKRYSQPQARLAKLQEIVAREVLYREGLENGVDRQEGVERRVADFRRDAVVEETVLSALRDRIKVSEGDLRNAFRADPSRYREPASARVRLGVFADEAKAREALAAKSEDDFARIVKESSSEPSSRERGGLLDSPVREGEPVPAIGPAPELVRAVMSADAGRPIGAPVKLAAGHAAAWVIEKSAGRVPPFEEVRERVARDYLREKQAEVQSDLVKGLFRKHQVSIATESFLGTPSGGEKPEAAPAPPAPGPAGAPPPPAGEGKP